MEETKLIALIPAYEPDEKLPKIVNELKMNNFTVIVVNDGSDINYQKFFDECNTEVISYPTNRGKGYALKKGLEHIKYNYKNYIVVTVDADGQHQIEDIINICEYEKNNKDTLVIGKRIRKDNVPMRSLIGNTITRYIFKFITNNAIYDTQSGLRAFSEQLIDYMLEIDGNRYEYEMNVLLYLKQNNIKHKEIEIKTIYIDNNKNSKFKTIRDSLRIYSEIINFKVVPILTFFIDLLIYGMLIIVTNKIIISNIISKIISITVYYLLNKKDIFTSTKHLIKQILISITTILLSTIIILGLSKITDSYTAKVITETILLISIHLIKNKISDEKNKQANKYIPQ